MEVHNGGVLTIVAIIVALFLAGLVLLGVLRLVARRRARRCMPPGIEPYGYGRGWRGGVREPRRPFSPAGAGSVALPLPKLCDDARDRPAGPVFAGGPGTGAGGTPLRRAG